jgi:hypothetical protein
MLETILKGLEEPGEVRTLKKENSNWFTLAA